VHGGEGADGRVVRDVDVTQALGFIKTKLDVQKYTDLSLIQEAAARLK